MADLGGVIVSSHSSLFNYQATTNEQTVLTLLGSTVRSEVNMDITNWTTPKIIRVRQGANRFIENSRIVLQKRWESGNMSDFDTGVTSIPLIIDSGYPFKFVTVQSEEAETALIGIPVFWIEVQL